MSEKPILSDEERGEASQAGWANADRRRNPVPPTDEVEEHERSDVEEGFDIPPGENVSRSEPKGPADRHQKPESGAG